MNTLANRQAIVVGVDGSEQALRAAVWAAAVAHRKKLLLRLAHALPSPGYHLSEVALPFRDESADEVERSADEILDLAEFRVRQEFPDVRLSVGTHPGPAGMSLVGLSKHAELVVLGATGVGAVKSLVTGSTVMRVVNHAHCPVTVFRPQGSVPLPDHRPVVVGVDGSELSAFAIESAVEFATMFEVPLLAVHAWGRSDVAGRLAALQEMNRPAIEEEQAVLMAESLAGWRAKFPDLQLTTLIEQNNAAEFLLECAEDAQLVVVGSHGHNRLAGSLLGSTSQNLLHHAMCPVTICRADT